MLGCLSSWSRPSRGGCGRSAGRTKGRPKLAAQVRAIDYPNFKATVRDAGRLHAYHDVWDVMARYQEVKHPRDR